MPITKVLEATSSFHKFLIIELKQCSFFTVFPSFFSISFFEFHTSRTVSSCSFIFYGWNLFSCIYFMDEYEIWKKSNEFYFFCEWIKECAREPKKKHLGKIFKFLSSCAWCGTHSSNKQLRKWNILLVINEKNASRIFFSLFRLLVPQ